MRPDIEPDVFVCISGFMCMTDSLCECVHIQETVNGESSSPQMSFLGELGNTAAALLLIHALSHTHAVPGSAKMYNVCVSMPSIHNDDCWVLTFSFTVYITNQLGRNQKHRGEDTRRTGEGINVYLVLYDL